MKKMKFTALLLIAAAVLAGCSASQPDSKRSPVTHEASKHAGVILYDNYGFHLVRVNIDGVDYIANSKGGLLRVEPSEDVPAVQP